MTETLSHADLLIYGTHWLFNTNRCRIVLTQPSCQGAGSSPDIIGWNDYECFFIEAKVSKTDFYADRRKYNWLGSNDCLMGSYRYYLMPEHLVQMEAINVNYGLLWLCGQDVTLVREAPLRTGPQRDLVSENQLLVAALRNEGERQGREKWYDETDIPKNPLWWVRDYQGKIYRQTAIGMEKTSLKWDLSQQLFRGAGSKPCKKSA